MPACLYFMCRFLKMFNKFISKLVALTKFPYLQEAPELLVRTQNITINKHIFFLSYIKITYEYQCTV